MFNVSDIVKNLTIILCVIEGQIYIFINLGGQICMTYGSKSETISHSVRGVECSLLMLKNFTNDC